MTQIHQFDTTIYPLLLWVAKTEDMSAINERFIADNEGRFSSDTMAGNEAVTSSVIQVSDNRKGMLVILGEKADVCTLAHEAVHVASGIFAAVNATMDVENDEPFAYLTDFAFDCLYQVFTDKFKEI